MTDITRKLALLCTVSVLTLGLAACNSTGTKTPAGGQPGGTPTPPAGQGDTSELGKAKAAAKTAMDAAKTASDGAETQAGNAETAAMGLALIQTGDPMAKKKAMEAREAARKAMAAYEKAKAESDRAAAATTITAAVTARRAAEAARAEAVKQQMAAAAAAKAATDAAAKEVRVTYDDDGKATVSVGETKIVAGSPKVETTTGGKTVTTGKIGDIKEDSDEYAKAAVQYVAATDDTPEVVSVTGFKGRIIPIGSYTDSEVADSKQSRLWLIDKYVSNTKAVKAYRKALNASNAADKVTAEATTSANPFGSVAGKRIMRAEGEFYIVDTPESKTFDKTNAWDTINSGATDANAGVGVYYYMDGSDRKYLLLDGTSGTSQFVYRRILVYDVPDFPEAKSYEHMNFGMWNDKKSDRTDLGTAFVTELPGGEGVTPTADMPNFGKATYKGYAVWQQRNQDPEGNGSIGGWDGVSTTMADFGKNTISTDIQKVFGWPADNAHGVNVPVVTLHGTIDGNGFSGSRITNVNTRDTGWTAFYSADDIRANVNLGTSADGSGYEVKEYRGNFFGPNAEEVGGVFDITSEDRKKGELRGSFGGRRGDIE